MPSPEEIEKQSKNPDLEEHFKKIMQENPGHAINNLAKAIGSFDAEDRKLLVDHIVDLEEKLEVANLQNQGLQKEIERCREIADRDGKDYSILNGLKDQAIKELEESNRLIESGRKLIERCRENFDDDLENRPMRHSLGRLFAELGTWLDGKPVNLCQHDMGARTMEGAEYCVKCGSRLREPLKRTPDMPKLDGPEPELSKEDQAALEAIRCKRCGLPGLRCVFCTPASSSTCGH